MGKKNIWLDGIMGLVVGDVLGCPMGYIIALPCQYWT